MRNYGRHLFALDPSVVFPSKSPIPSLSGPIPHPFLGASSKAVHSGSRRTEARWIEARGTEARGIEARGD